MLEINEFQRILQQLLPNEDRDDIIQFATLLLQLAKGIPPTESVASGMANRSQLINYSKKLRGVNMTAENTLISFGDNSQLGDVTFRDIAGGNIVTFNLHINSDIHVHANLLINVPNIPHHLIARNEYIASIKATLLHSDEKIVGLHGMGGIGKTTTASLIAHDDEIRSAFPDSIIWITLGQETNILYRQNQLIISLSKDSHLFQDIQQGTAILSKILSGKKCLIIIDDVWSIEQLQAFPIANTLSKLLITTRNSSIIRAIGAVSISIDKFDKEQSLNLIEKASKISMSELPKEAFQILDYCENLPFALALVGSIMLEKPERWKSILRRFANRDFAKINLSTAHYPYSNVFEMIDVSVNHLDKEIRSRFFDLAIFPEDSVIPISALVSFWGTIGLDEDDVQDILQSLEDKSLVSRYDYKNVMMHDLYIEYVRSRIGITLTFKERMREKFGDGTKVKKYAIQHLHHHLIMADEGERLATILLRLGHKPL